MATVVVAWDGATRINDADANTNWGNWPSGGPAPASEPQLRYQYSGTGSVGAVNKKITSTASLAGISYDPGSGAVSMLTETNRLWFAKVIVADFADLNTTYGVNLAIGSASTAMFEYNVAGSGANRSVYSQYNPAQGGYLIVPIDPRILAYREATTGTPDLSAVDWFGVQCRMVNGSAKNENLAMDAIDIGRGLKLTRGDGVSTDGNYLDYVAWDQDTLANRYGVVVSTAPNLLVVRGILTIGETANPTEFFDETSVVVFPDGYHSAGSVGVVYNVDHTSTVLRDSCLMIGAGKKDADQDTRPDLIVEWDGTGFGYTDFDDKIIRNFRRVLIPGSGSGGTFWQDGKIETSGQVDPVNSDYGGYQTLDGTGDYIDTSAAVNYTTANGDVEFIFRVLLDDWTPATTYTIFDWGTSTGRYRILYMGTNVFRLQVWDATANSVLDSFSMTGTHSDSPRMVDGEWVWVRVTYDASVASANWYWSKDPANTPPQDIVWRSNGTPSGTARNPGAINQIAYIGADSTPTNLLVGSISYFSMWDGIASGGLQVFMADWRTGPDFTGSPPARADGIQSVNWEENGNPVYTLGDNFTNMCFITSTVFFQTTSYAALKIDVNDATPNITGARFVGNNDSHAIEFGKNCPATVTLTDINFGPGYNNTNGNADSHLYNNTGGALTVELVNHTGGTISYRNGVGASTTVNAAVVITLKGVVSGSQCAVYAVDDDSQLMNETAAGVDVTESYTGTTPRDVIIRVRKGDTHEPYVASGQIVELTGLTVTVDQRLLNV